MFPPHVQSNHWTQNVNSCIVCTDQDFNFRAHDFKDDLENGYTVLPVLRIPVEGATFKNVLSWALLDPGSTNSLIQSSSVEKYNYVVVKDNVELTLKGASGIRKQTTKVIKIFIPNKVGNSYLCTIDCTVLPKLPAHGLLKQPFNPHNVDPRSLNNHKKFAHYNSFDVIVGVSDLWKLLTGEMYLGENYIGFGTYFGTVFAGVGFPNEEHANVDANFALHNNKRKRKRRRRKKRTNQPPTFADYNNLNSIGLALAFNSEPEKMTMLCNFSEVALTDKAPKVYDQIQSNNLEAQLKQESELIDLTDDHHAKYSDIDHYVKSFLFKSRNLTGLQKELATDFVNQYLGEDEVERIANAPLYSYNASRILPDLAVVAELLAKQEEIEKLDTAEQSTADQFAAKQMLDKVLTYDKKEKIFTTDLLIRAGSELENNYFHTHSRFIAGEKKALSNPEARKIYTQEFRKFIDLGVVEEVEDDTPHLGDHKHYLPTVIVNKPDSTSTPWRVCLDAGAVHKKDSPSLNDCIFDSPTINNNLISVEMNARWREFLILSDIRKLYLQIRMRPTSRNLLRYLWRDPDEKGGKIRIFRFVRSIWGVKDSGFVAMAAVEKLFLMRIENLSREFPGKTKEEIATLKSQLEYCHSCFYVDDFILSADSLDELLFLFKLVQETLSLGSLKLCKISSNSPEALKAFPDDLKEKVVDYYVQNKNPPKTKFPIKISENCSILGYAFSPAEDAYLFSKYKDLDKKFVWPLRKIDLASLLPRIYDNLNLLGPWKFLLKRAMRHINLAKLDWKDSADALEKHEAMDIKNFLSDIPLLEHLKFTRWVEGTKDSKILVFCDASKKGVCTMIYCVTKKGNKYVSHLLSSACDIAPLKSTRVEQDSCPKLELTAAKLAIKHAKPIVESLSTKYRWGLKKDQFYCITDSAVVLAWLKQVDTSKQTIYVRERVKYIKDLGLKWFHIRTDLNLADIGSRGARLKLLGTSMYQHGYEWIRSDPSTYPLNEKIEYPFVDDKTSYKVLEGIQKRYIMAFMAQEMNIPERNKTIIAYGLNLFSLNCPIYDDYEYQHLLISYNNVMNYGLSKIFQPGDHHSSFRSMKRALALVLMARDTFKRLLIPRNARHEPKRAKPKRNKSSGAKTNNAGLEDFFVPGNNLKEAELFLLKQDQRLHFKTEIDCVLANKNVPLHSPIKNLSPFMGNDGFLRARNRLDHYPDEFVSPSMKQQIILPDSELVGLFVLYDHYRKNHPNREAHKQTLLENFFIVHQNTVVERASKKCLKCAAVNSKAQNQKSGVFLHPETEVDKDTPFKLFRFCGIDSSGPILLHTIDKGSFMTVTKNKVDRRMTRAKQRAYDIHKEYSGGLTPETYHGCIQLFVCLESGAVHLEPASSLKTGPFLQALKRFLSKYTTPLRFVSDRAGIFSKTEKILRHSVTEANKEKERVALNKEKEKAVNNLDVCWSYTDSFQSFSASNWERAFRSVKENLQKLSASQAITFEDLTTLCTIIADNLNNLPKFPDEFRKKHNLVAVCPNDLIKGHRGSSIPINPHELDPKIVNDDSIIANFKGLEAMRTQIVEDCAKSFLLRRSKRNRWVREQPPFRVGDLVKVRNIHTKKKISKTNLPSAIISEVIPGRDDTIRHYKIDYGSNDKSSKRLRYDRFEVRPHHDLYLVKPSDEGQANHIEFVTRFFERHTM